MRKAWIIGLASVALLALIGLGIWFLRNRSVEAPPPPPVQTPNVQPSATETPPAAPEAPAATGTRRGPDGAVIDYSAYLQALKNANASETQPTPVAPTPAPAGPDPNADPDHDGLTNLQEQQYGTNPNNPDTDGDGYHDGAEVKAGYNPLGPGKLLKTP